MSEHVAELRAIARELPPAPEPMGPYLEQVRVRAYEIADADVEALKDAGLSEDVIFEQTVGVAVREGLRRLDAALEAIG